MSIGSILNNARSGLLAAQRAVEVTSNNVANAQTAGYTRQRVETAAQIPTRFADGEFGAGVRVIGTTRARDQFLDANFRRASADASGGRLRTDGLGRLETILGEPSDTGLGAALDTFYGAWSDLAARPTAGGVQGAVQQAGAQLALQFNRVAQQLDEFQVETRQRLEAAVNEVNELATAIADLNRQVVAQESGGQSANTLRDERDQKLDRLVALTGASVVEQPNGATSVLLGGLSLVDSTEVRPIAAVTANGVADVTRASDPTRPVIIGGELGALRQLSVVDIPTMQADIDTLARGVIDAVNAVHRQGVTWSGAPPTATAAGDFYAADPLLSAESDPLRTARGMRLDSAVAASASAIAASGATATGPGDGSIALAIAGLRTSDIGFTNPDGSARVDEPAGTFLQRVATNVAFAVKSTSDRTEVDEAIMTQADTRRQEVSGVSVDEELVRLIKFQQAYAAAARLVNTADAMAQTLLDLR
ncbi:MAG: flagellar hook-associated protein FlgK [Gemmatimonadaceae bacterium]|nr:flagellar hook-associated protein FlgK [Gemmatimonadaceae bacterium]